MNSASEVFIISSTINTPLGLVPVSERLEQTLNTVASIRKHLPRAGIILVDNSSTPVPRYTELESSVDVFLDIGQRRICRHFNSCGIKGAGESYNILVGLDALEKSGVTAWRIFKISGRYRLSDSFDIGIYHNMQGKFCFRQRDQNSSGDFFLHSRMWSACGSQLAQMRELVSKSFQTHLEHEITIEQALYKNLDQDTLVELDTIHCEGIIAPWNTLVRD